MPFEPAPHSATGPSAAKRGEICSRFLDPDRGRQAELSGGVDRHFDGGFVGLWMASGHGGRRLAPQELIAEFGAGRAHLEPGPSACEFERGRHEVRQVLVDQVPQRALLDHELAVGNLRIHHSLLGNHGATLCGQCCHGVAEVFEDMLRQSESNRNRTVVWKEVAGDRDRRMLGRTETFGVIAGIPAKPFRGACLAQHRQEVARAGAQFADTSTGQIVRCHEALRQGTSERLEAG